MTKYDLDRICELANKVEDELDDLDNETITGLLDAVHDIQSDATKLRGLVECIEPDEDEDEDEDYLGKLIPDVLSLGEYISLRDTLNEWRVKNGYSRI